MGAVKLETKSQGRGNHQWDFVSLNSLEVIDVLIRFRSRFDETYLAKQLYQSSPMVTNGIPDFVEIVTCMYVDLDNYIKNAKLYRIERYIVKKLMLGYSIQDITQMLNIWVMKKYTERNITNVFKNTCKKILHEYKYNYDWSLFMQGHVKIHKDKKYRVCSICNKSYERINKNFVLDRNSIDGMKNICKACARRNYSINGKKIKESL